MEQSAGILLEIKDLDATKGTGVIRHSVYNSIDLAGDISTRGMFTKSWNEAKEKGLTKSINLLFNHNNRIGFVTDVFENDGGGYTEFKLLKSKIQDIAEMVDAGAITGASFGYHTIKKDNVEIKGKRIRKLLEVKHLETSLLDVPPCHPEAGLITLNKAFEDIEQEDASALLQWNDEQVQNMKAYVTQLEGYCRKAKASDDTILALQKHLLEYKQIIQNYDTALTSLATKPGASDDEGNAITTFLNSLNIEIWKKQSLSNSRS